MYTPAMFKPDRAASLAFAEARIRYGLRMGRHQARRILAAVLLCRPPFLSVEVII